MGVIRLMFIGDIVGEDGVEFACQMIPVFRQKYKVHFCVANGENSHQGKGINEEIVKSLYKNGVDVISGGDHSFDKHLIFNYMKSDPKLLRPYNYPQGVPGFGYGVYDIPDTKHKISIINLRGLSFFNNPINCPFRALDYILSKVNTETILSFVDFHAEATAEKIAFAWYADGRVSAIAGTHTHVQTADAQIFPKGTGYITDVGFTGAHHSVIGMDIQTSINRFLYQTPQKYKTGEGSPRMNGIVFHIDTDTAKTIKLEPFTYPAFEREITN